MTNNRPHEPSDEVRPAGDEDAVIGTGAGAGAGAGAEHPESAGSSPEAPALVVTVTRTGGFAGIRRVWTVSAPPADVERLTALVVACPWEADVADATGADRFAWMIGVTGHEQHERALPDSAVQGPWESLVAAVRDAARSGAPRPDHHRD